MNHIRLPQSPASSTAPCPRHVERGLGASDPGRRTESKDPMPAESDNGELGSFRIVVRFFDEHAPECIPDSRLAAATECSPRATLWETSAADPGPEGVKEPAAGQSRQ